MYIRAVRNPLTSSKTGLGKRPYIKPFTVSALYKNNY
jgi:hypothetical protein